MPSPFESVLFPAPCKLACGVDLLPVAVIHGHALEVMESPFAEGGGYGVEDFALAVLVLSTPAADLYRQGGAAVADTAKKRIAKIAEYYAAHAADFRDDSKRLSAHLADALRGFRVKKSKGKTQSAIPYFYSLAVSLRTSFGMTEADAMTRLVRSAILDIQTLSELRGARNVISSATAELLDKIAKEKKAKK